MKFSCVKPVKIKEDKRFRERKKKKHLHDLYVHNQKLNFGDYIFTVLSVLKCVLPKPNDITSIYSYIHNNEGILAID